MPRFRSDLLAVAMFCASLLLLAFAYGVAVGRFEIFPYAVITDAISSAKVNETPVDRREIVAVHAHHLHPQASDVPA